MDEDSYISDLNHGIRQHYEDDADEEEASSSAVRLFICHVLVT